MMNADKPIKIAITGAGGNIAYALLFRIATGHLFGDRLVELRLIEKSPNEVKLDGVIMELEDCATPLITNCLATADLHEGLEGADIVILLGARPRTKGMERKELLESNGGIFKFQGSVINETVARDAKILVVGNPANTNALIALSHAPDLNPNQFSCLTRLDHNRALSMIAKKVNAPLEKVSNVAIWGNHSSTQFPDTAYCRVAGEPLEINSEWIEKDFIPAVQQRGAAIIKARGDSSAASAANACIEHIRDWTNGTPADDWVSMGILSDSSYGSPQGVFFSYPVTVDSDVRIVKGLTLNDFQKEKIMLSAKELIEEKQAVASLMGNHPSL